MASSTFTPLPRKSVDLLLTRCREIADANNCTYIDASTQLGFVPTEDGSRVVLDIRDPAGNSVGKPSKWGSQTIMFVGTCDKMFIRADSAVRDDAMTGTEKQTMYIKQLDGNKDSENAVKQLLDTYSITAWSKAVGKCKNHGLASSAKAKNPSAKQLGEHAAALATRGGVFFPTSSNDLEDPDRCLKFSAKLVLQRKQHVPATGTGFDIPAVNNYFEEASDCGVRLIEFLGRDGHPFTGNHGDIQQVGAGLFIVTIHPDYYAAKISKVTTPHRLQTVVCIDVTTSSGGSKAFAMPNIQNMLEPPSSHTATDAADTTDDELTDDAAASADAADTFDVNAFVAKRRRVNTP